MESGVYGVKREQAHYEAGDAREFTYIHLYFGLSTSLLSVSDGRFM